MAWLQPKSKIDFVGMRSFAAVCSVIMVICSLFLFIFVEPTWGIDFTGGTEIHLKFEKETSITSIRGALEKQGLSGDSVQQIGVEGSNEFVIRVQDPSFGTTDLEQTITNKLETSFGADWVKEMNFEAQVDSRFVVVYNGDEVSLADVTNALSGTDAIVSNANDDNTFYLKVPGLSSKISNGLKSNLEVPFKVLQADTVGPKVGSELRQQGIVSIMATLILILVYVAFRFNLSFAPGAVLALFHDVTIVVGVFILLDQVGWTHEFNLPMIGALLTIIGYSLNDTIVIYDRIRENMTRYRRHNISELINDSINETLGRTLATSLTTLMGMAAFLWLGGAVIQTFALAIAMGVLVGTYSTIFVASPTILLMQDLQPKLAKFFAPLAQNENEPKEELLEAE